MPVRPIVKLGHEALGQRAEPITSWDEELEALVADMVETMHAANGVGLAANQIGLPHDLAIIDVAPGTPESELHVLTNPEIVETAGVQEDDEGCLSVPGFVAVVRRPERAVVRFRDVRGEVRELEGTGLLARAICHEVDHLHGTLYIQRVPGVKGELLRRRARKAAKRGDWEDVYP